ncbi:glycosyltransferase [Salinibacter sp.]|uniref:glycosyltransferase n=1 Tax=Salinibacter sp. TaxID=2065818 RepID=UPI0021E750D8|nr:glycosyltransferase [Salinibacter sp.]
MATNAHICIVTGSHLCRNPRVVKEAGALDEAGYDVTVLGPVFNDDLRAEDRALLTETAWDHRASVDLRPCIEGTWARLRRKIGTHWTRWGGESPHALGYGVASTLRRARSIGADLYIGHEEVGTWVVRQLLDEGARVGADFEDWHTRDLLPKDRVGRPLGLLEDVERTLLRHAEHVTTTSKALAQAMASTYEAPVPTVIYNAFPWADREALNETPRDRDGSGRPSLHWVSQTIGPGRGLETLCRALQDVERPMQVHLRGQCRPDYHDRLDARFPSENGHDLFVHDLVSPDELLGRIAEHDVGLALEQYEPESRNRTITNKILHYLLGGLAVVATDTDGQREVADKADGAVRLCAPDDSDELARQIRHFVRSENSLERAQSDALRAARETFSWEQQAPRLLTSIETVLR